MGKNDEYKIQAAFVQLVSLKYPETLMTISPAGMIMSPGTAMKMIRMGYRRGTPDIIILEPRGKYHGLFIEFKTPTGTVSDDQKTFIQWAILRGYLCYVCRSAEYAFEIFESYI